MILPEKPKNEKERLDALYSYSILDSLTDPDFDNLVRIASEICGTPISLISLIDNNRQWFKAKKGIEADETPRSEAFCAHAINDPEQILEVEDATLDPRFQNNPNVINDPHIAFYAGIPLVDDQGFALGTLCVIDKKPRKLTSEQRETLKALSQQVINLMELRRKRLQLEEMMTQLQRKNPALREICVDFGS